VANTNLRCVEFCTWFSAKFAHFGSRRFLAALFSWVVSAAIAGLLAFGCGGSSPTVTSITVSPSPAALITGTSQNTQQFKATGNLSDGTTNDLTRLVVWSSSNTSAATIQSNTGMATAAGDGVTTITATYGSGSSAPTASAVLTVNLGSVTVTPPNPSILVSATQQFAATAAYLDRTTSDVTQAATWSSSNPSFATMSTTTPGLATGVSVGDSNITATVGSTQSNQAVLAVTSGSPTLTGISLAPTSDSVMVGMTVQYTATGTYSDGSTQDVTTQATWASSSSGVATISNSAGSQGLATAVAAGSTNISATIGSVSGNAMLTVTPKVVTNASRYQLSLGLTNLYVDAIVPTTGQLRAVSFLDVNNGLNYNRGLLTHPNGQVVYLVSIPSIGLQVATYSLSPSGQLAPVGSPITSQNYQGVPIIDPIGRFLYLEDDSQDIVVFPLDPNTGVPGTASNAAAAVPSPGLMAIDSTGTYLFVQTGATLSSYQINGTTGALTAIGSPTNAASSIGALVVTPSGKSIYELDGATHSIYGFSISKGALTPLTNSPFAVPATGDPLQMAVDPSGSFLYLTEQSADGLFGFTIGGNGSLSAMQGGASFAIGSGPNLLNADASGKFLYVSNAFTNEVWTYAIGSGTGLLTKSSQMRDQGTTAQALANGTALTFTPTAMFLAIESGDVAQFSINSSTGELAPMSTPLLGAGVEPQTVVTDPYDLFAYSPSLKASNLVSFSISSDGL